MWVGCIPIDPARCSIQLLPTHLPQQAKAIYGEREYVQKTLQGIKAAGFNVIRMWAFNDGEGSGKLQTTPGEGLGLLPTLVFVCKPCTVCLSVPRQHTQKKA
jgi:hypothetical protein